MKIHISDNIISGTLEVIKCKNVEIRYGDEATIPVLQVDNSAKVHVYIQKKSQIDSILFIRSEDVILFLENQIVKGESGLTLRYDVSANESLDVQRIGYWNTLPSGSDFMIKNRIEYSNLSLTQGYC